jgi:hypothetical protein
VARALSVSLPAAIAAEISVAAARAERSVGFLVHGALKSAGALSGPAPAGEPSALSITTDDDDPKDLAARLQKLAAEKAQGATLDVAVALAWAARRAQILAWVERVAAVNVGERADDLDDGLREAGRAETSPERLLVLAQSAYPRVRALVVLHPRVPEAALELLGKDREKAVRQAFTERK